MCLNPWAIYLSDVTGCVGPSSPYPFSLQRMLRPSKLKVVQFQSSVVHQQILNATADA